MNTVVYCQTCSQVISKLRSQSWAEHSVRKFCSRRCSGQALRTNQSYKERCRRRMLGNTINVGRHHPSRKTPPPRSAETRAKIGAFNKGRYAGSKNHFWKGGVTPLIRRLRSSVEYQQWRKAVFERDNYTCVNCGKHGGTLNADHIKPFAHFPELRFDITNGRTLCFPCHRATPTFGGNGGKKLYVVRAAL